MRHSAACALGLASEATSVMSSSGHCLLADIMDAVGLLVGGRGKVCKSELVDAEGTHPSSAWWRFATVRTRRHWASVAPLRCRGCFALIIQERTANASNDSVVQDRAVVSRDNGLLRADAPLDELAVEVIRVGLRLVQLQAGEVDRLLLQTTGRVLRVDLLRPARDERIHRMRDQTREVRRRRDRRPLASAELVVD